ncbi:MAG: hypothetical protein AB7U29_20155 [Desulfobulbus sp.]
MAGYKIKCEAISVSTKSNFCPGSAKCKQGEVYTFGSRTPEPGGMCGRAFHAVHPIAFSMRFSERMPFENDEGYYDVICPDGFVTYRLSRV